MKARDHGIGVDIFVGLAGAIKRCDASRDELALVNAALQGGAHRLLHKFRQGFALTQQALEFCTKCWFDANGWDGGCLQRGDGSANELQICSLLMETLDYGAVARKYAEQVQAGEILVCRLVKAAAQRQLNDWIGNRGAKTA